MSMLPRFGRYASVALMSAGADWAVFSLLVTVLGAAHLPSLMAARIAGGAASFLANRYWTWDGAQGGALTRQGRRFLLLYGLSYGLSVALFSALTRVLGVPAYPAKLLTDLGCFIVNFLVMNHYVYHTRRGLSRVLGAVRRRRGDAGQMPEWR